MGFLELGHNYEFSPAVRRGAQGASRVAPGKSGLYACDEGVLTLMSCVTLNQPRVFILPQFLHIEKKDGDFPCGPEVKNLP